MKDLNYPVGSLSKLLNRVYAVGKSAFGGVASFVALSTLPGVGGIGSTGTMDSSVKTKKKDLFRIS